MWKYPSAIDLVLEISRRPPHPCRGSNRLCSTYGAGSANHATTQNSAAEGNDIYRIGGDVSPPVLVHAVTPQFPKEARGISAKVNVQ
jgi:hypothetical protein